MPNRPVFLFVAFVFLEVSAANPPEVSYTAPLALRPGQVEKLTFHGNYLDGITHVWTGFEGDPIIASSHGEPSTEGTSASARIRIAKDVEFGIYAARLVTRSGVSHPILLMVDDLPSTGELSKNNSRQSPQLIPFPSAVDGAGNGTDSDFYCFDASAGQSISIEVVATRLGYSFDPVVRVFDESSHEIASADDSPGLNGDCHLQFSAPLPQRYTIEIIDARYTSSERHKYRLRVGDFPLVTTTMPLAAVDRPPTDLDRDVSSQSLAFCQAVGAQPESVVLGIRPTADRVTHPISARFSPSGGSAIAKYSLSSLPNLVLQDSDLHNSPDSGPLVQSPVAVNNVFRSAGAVHNYRLKMSAGQRQRVVGITRSLGSPADLLVKVYSPDGKLLSTNDDFGMDEASFEIDPKLDGDHLLSVQEINGQHGSGYSYRMEVTQASAGFELSAGAERIIIGQGGVGLLPIQCVRRGYDGPIALRIDQVESPFQLDNPVIESGAKETLLRIAPRETLQPGDFHMLGITGIGQIDGVDIERRVNAVDAVRAIMPAIDYPPGELFCQIAVSMAQPLPEFFGLRLGAASVEFPRIVGETYFTVHCTDRIDGFSQAVDIVAHDLPKGFATSGNERPVGNSKNNEYRFELNGPKDFPLGSHKIAVRAIGNFRGQTKEVRISPITLQVIEPLIVSLELVSTDTVRSEVVFRANAKRFVPRGGGDRKEIRCSWKTLPDWLTSTDSFVIGAGKNDATVRMSIGERSAATGPGQVAIEAETQVDGQTVRVTSDVLKIDIPVSN